MHWQTSRRALLLSVTSAAHSRGRPFPKGLVRKELLETIRAVHAGQRRVHPEVASELAAHLGEEALTARELEVLRLVAAGNSNKEIGRRLNVTEQTAKAHMRRIAMKLGANDRTHAVTLAQSRGFLTG